MTEDETRELAELRAEVARLTSLQAAHVCPSVPVCTCGGTATAGVTGCPVHSWPSRVETTTLRPGQNICGAADNGFGNVIINTAGCADRPVIQMPLNIAGCAAGQTYTVTIPAS